MKNESHIQHEAINRKDFDDAMHLMGEILDTLCQIANHLEPDMQEFLKKTRTGGLMP